MSSAQARSPRERLLDAAVAYVEANGLSDLSLRALAAALGTSHRMLIHHFGSKEGLWVAVIQEVEERQRRVLSGLLSADPGRTPADTLRAWWRHVSDPSLWPSERLFFEVYGQALQGRPHAVALLDGIVDSWLEPATEAGIALGMDPDTARTNARLGLAVTRGLLLDLLATGDREAVDAAMERFIELALA